MPKTEILYVRIPKEISEHLEIKADEAYLSVAKLVTVILSDWILRGSPIPRLQSGIPSKDGEGPEGGMG
jgi:hypothetical protein